MSERPTPPVAPPPRRYDDREIALVLRRAAELQRDDRGPAAVANAGLTIDELTEVAKEAGIDPRHVRQAARELRGGGLTPPTIGDRLLGGPASIVLEQVCDGEVHPSAFAGMIVELQNASGGVGQPAIVGRTLTWQSAAANQFRTLAVHVVGRDGRTEIRIEERLHELAGGLFGGLIGGAGGGVGLGVGLGVGIGALGSAAFAIAFPITMIAGSFAMARTIFGGHARKRQRALADCMERLVEQVEASVRAQLPVPAQPTLESGGSPDQ